MSDDRGDPLVVAARSPGPPPQQLLHCTRRAVPDSLRPWVVPKQRNAWVLVCDGGRTLQQVWPSLAGRN